ncbi:MULTISPECIES: dynamin family protein [Streptomyces]|uniref:Dynamin family protein n=1 Tax=Streptomyces koelreuteriae TaxID=2838015 RepID=A0ABX8G2K9_9ACTN|nr:MULTISPECIES: dynamin family protein [Streptomyces]QWB27748.1 dynamin family protein [Streptomyces koelreuteriae]UUA10848.1 dynamin family protein [Streptomyces koelreuteriae]UUA18454.1 dynamin family protein [Streptomyces sp. CRCS-T-1]
MSDGLADRVKAAFESALRLMARGGGSAEVLRAAFEAERGRAGKKMSVAVVGRISTGKSTLVNALIGEERVATGSQELTFNVNRLRYSETPRLLVRYKDGRPSVPYSPERLEELTARREDHLEELRGIAEVVVEIPAPYLEDFELIDTPGLDCVFGEDSLNTLEFLRLRPEDVMDASLRHASAADALILVLPVRGPSRTDADVVAQFLGPDFATSTPLTTLGVLTKCEYLWEEGGPHPLVLGRRQADRIMRDAPGMRRRLFDLTPVCGLLGQAAATLDEETVATFEELAKAPSAALSLRLSDAKMFVNAGDGFPLDAARRRALWNRFGPYGIHTVCGLLRDGVRDPAKLRAILLDDSGLTGLRGRLTDHFGHRSALLKLDGSLERIRRMPKDLAAGAGPRERSLLDAALGGFEALALNEPGFAELRTLRELYSGRLRLGVEENEELRRALGEFGRSPAARLGLPEGAGADALRAEARRRHSVWLVRWQSGMLYGPSREAARTVVRAYEHLLHELEESHGPDARGEGGGREV